MNKLYTALAMMSAIVPFSSQAENSLKDSKPNIILVMTDDQGYGDLGCHGHPFIKTPNLDKLYGQSQRFTNFHASPTCAPTRAALMSGRAPYKNGITHTILERERMTLEATTVAEVLKSAGYTTGIFGKWHLGDADEYQPDQRGFDEVFIHGAGGIGQNYPGTQGAVPGTSYFNPIIKHNKKFVQTEGYCTDVFFKQALGWIKEQKDKPFFAYIASNAPHGPFIVADNYKKMYADHTKVDKQQAFFGMITNIDENMGLLMTKLDEWDLADNTLLIFMTDNGSSVGSRIFNAGMKGAKASANEGGSRVPLFMRLPGKINAGVDVKKLTRHYDLMPTFAELAGAELSDDLDLDGRSLLTLINKPEAQWADRNLFFHGARWNKKGAGDRWGKGNTDPEGAKYTRFAVRTEKWRLVGKALYNIEKDPGEKKDVSQEYPEIAAEMLKSFDAWWLEVRPLMVNEDAPLDTGKPFIEQFDKQKAQSGIPAWKEPKL
ncbi:arylsulfatase [Lentisphaera profundi]|uniref:Arylsulfatase n=2 Tax=Lentisphaera profundi TaxID=1658616 RepID=A0ABY7VUF5_9BACT|nr:arylsulfatase [Lentisphaera profundi]WDE96522.1 arylsulfatase [Lentisphaera profundi]